MSNFDIYPELPGEAAIWPRLLLVVFSNACIGFLLFCGVLQLNGLMAGVLYVVGLVATPGVAAAVFVSSVSRERPARLSAAASAGYFALVFALGAASEFAPLWGLAELFWSGQHFG